MRSIDKSVLDSYSLTKTWCPLRLCKLLPSTLANLFSSYFLGVVLSFDGETWGSSVKAQSTKKSSQPFSIECIHQIFDMCPASRSHRLNLTSEWHKLVLKIWHHNVTRRYFCSAPSKSGNLFLSLTHRQSDRLKVPLLLTLPISVSFPSVFLTH